MIDWIPLKRVAHLTYGNSLPSEFRKEGEVPVVGSGGVSGYHDESNVRSPGIIVGRKGSFGSVNWISSESFAIDTAYFLDMRSVRASMRWLYYVLLAVDLKGSSQDVGVPGLSREAAHNVMVPWIQNAREQRLVADFLDTEVDYIDRSVSVRRRQWNILEEREISHLSERLIPGSLGRATGDFPWPWLPELPASVPMVRLGYVCQIQGGVTVDASRGSSETDVTRPYLRVANVKADRLELDSVTEITLPKAVADRSTLHPGDVLMTEGGDIDKLGRGVVWNGELPQALHQNHVFALRPDHERLNAEYLALLTRSLHGRCYFEATGVKSTNLASTSSSKVRSFPVPLVPLGEQRKIVTEVNSALDEMSRLRSAVQNQIDLLQERKRALITAAVTGQIDVTTARGADVS